MCPLQSASYAPDDLTWLVGAGGAELLADAATRKMELVRLLEGLRTCTTPARAAMVVEQLQLRRRARDKFASAEQMFFTARGLEQATDQWIAAYKASRLAGYPRRYDLCTGIGGDLLALGHETPATGFDLDLASVTFAAANARVLQRPTIEVCQQDVTTLDLTGCDAWHLDPDRRPQGHRTTRVDLHEPSTSQIDTMLEQNPQAAIKLAPAATCADSWLPRAEWEWIGRDRQCRQLVAWFGDLAQARGQHRATVLDGQGTATSFTGTPATSVAVADKLAAFISEPDAAVLAARLDGALACTLGVQALAHDVAYWTSPQPIVSPLCSTFEVLEELPLDRKRLRAALRALDAGTLEIKVRGISEDPSDWRRKLQVAGRAPFTLFLTRLRDARRAIIARRVPV